MVSQRSGIFLVSCPGAAELWQAIAVGAIGYCLGIAMTAGFFEIFKDNLDLRGFRLLQETMAGTGVVVLLIVMLAIRAASNLRSLASLEPSARHQPAMG